MDRKEDKKDSWNILECSECRKAFKTPKCLPCIHTFCLDCLEKYGVDERPGDEMPCPLCRQLFKIPAEGFKKLPNNIFIEQILASQKIFHENLSSKEVMCDGCKKKKSSKYCVDCAQPICDKCSIIHANLTASRTHRVGPLQEMKTSKMSLTARPAFCDTHQEKQLELYCHVCNKTICLMCSAADHRNHLCEDIQKSSTKFVDEIISVLPKLAQSIEKVANEQSALENNKIILHEQISECERAVNKQRAELPHQQHTDAQCSKLFKQLEEIKIKETTKIQTRKDKVDRQLLMLSSLRAYMEKLVEKGSACAISQSAKDLLVTAKQLHADQVEFSKSSLSLNRVAFVPASTKMENIFVGFIDVYNSMCQVSEFRVFVFLHAIEKN